LIFLKNKYIFKKACKGEVIAIQIKCRHEFFFNIKLNLTNSFDVAIKEVASPQLVYKWTILDGVIGSSVLITPPLHQPNIVIYLYRRCNLIFLFYFYFFWPFGMISKIMQLGALFQLPTGGEGFSAHAPSKGCFQASVGGPF
jgi:hypothetical protein